MTVTVPEGAGEAVSVSGVKPRLTSRVRPSSRTKPATVFSPARPFWLRLAIWIDVPAR